MLCSVSYGPGRWSPTQQSGQPVQGCPKGQFQRMSPHQQPDRPDAAQERGFRNQYLWLGKCSRWVLVRELVSATEDGAQVESLSASTTWRRCVGDNALLCCFHCILNGMQWKSKLELNEFYSCLYIAVIHANGTWI